MYKAGVINGMDDTHFAPDGTVTKGQFATLIVNALKIDTRFIIGKRTLGNAIRKSRSKR